MDATEGRPRLALSDKHGKTRALLEIDGTEPGLLVTDSSGNVRAVLVLSDEGPQIALFSRQGKRQAVLDGIAGGHFVLYDAAGNVHYRVPEQVDSSSKK